jgi:hypothetical protein
VILNYVILFSILVVSGFFLAGSLDFRKARCPDSYLPI